MCYKNEMHTHTRTLQICAICSILYRQAGSYKCIAELNGLCVNIYSNHSKNVQINKCKIFQFKWINFSSWHLPPALAQHLPLSLFSPMASWQIAGKSLQLKFCTLIFFFFYCSHWMFVMECEMFVEWFRQSDNWKLINWQTAWWWRQATKLNNRWKVTGKCGNIKKKIAIEAIYVDICIYVD